MTQTESLYDFGLADLYDELKAGDDYQAWGRLIAQQLRSLGARGNRLLDVGCGTGNSSVALAQQGFSVVGCDISAQMVAIARKKLACREISFFRADMRELPEHLKGFDVVNWMDDVANHLLSESDLFSAFRRASSALNQGGLLTFDVNTAAAFRTILAGNSIAERDDLVVLIRGLSGPFVPSEPSRTALTTFRRSATNWERRDGEVVERYFEPSIIKTLLSRAGMQHLCEFGHS